MFVFPSGNSPFLPCRAAALEGAVLADVGPIPPHLKPLLLGCGAVFKRLACRAAIDVGVVLVCEVGLHEMPFRPGTGRIRPWHGRGDARLVAREDLLGAEIAFVGQDMHILALQGCLRLCCHFGQKIAVVPLIGDLVRHDQMGLGIDNTLNIIADMSAVLRTCRHGPRIWIGQ